MAESVPPVAASPPTLLRVVHVASGREWRGGQRQVLLLASGLASAPGIESVVVTGDDSRLAERCRQAGVTVCGVTWQVGIDPRVMAGLLGQLGPETLVHAHDQHAHTLADAAARIRGGTVIVTRRVDFPIRHPGRWQRVRRAIAVSKSVAERIRAIGVDQSRISVIPPGIELDLFASPPPWPAAIPPRPPGRRLVVAIAALTPEKGVDLLLDAARLLAPSHPDLDWIVLGEGPERRRLEQRRRDGGLEAVVSFPGQVEHPEAVLAVAALMVQPSRSEGFGSSVLDALSLGIPVIASDAGGLPEALAAGGGVIVPTGDPHALAAEVRALLADPARRERLSGDGRLAAGEFSLPRMVSRTLAVYRSALAERAME